jgi:hypothetical protein
MESFVLGSLAGKSDLNVSGKRLNPAAIMVSSK